MGCQTTYSCPITIPSSLPTPGTDGADGADGVSPHIGINGNWYVGTTDTGVSATGSDGTNGSSVLFNSMGTLYTASTPGVASLVSYSIPGGTLAAGDIVDIEAIYYLTTFVGSFQLNFGTAVAAIASYNASANTDAPPALGDPAESPTGDVVIKFNARVNVKTAAVEYITCEKVYYGIPSVIIHTPPAMKAENSVNAILVDVRASVTSGVIRCYSLTVIHSKKA